MRNPIVAIFAIVFLTSTFGADESSLAKQEPTIVGAMKEVMWGGRLSGRIELDSIPAQSHLFGLGPIEYLRGEIIILDGAGYSSTISKNGKVIVTGGLKLKAPFFCYQNIPQWYSGPLPDSIVNNEQLESYLNRINHPTDRTFLFKIEAEVDSARIHVVNLPKGAKVTSPDDAHKGQFDIHLRGRALTLLGFYSNHHQSIFTHHDTFLHIHVISKEKDVVGHLDRVNIKPGTARIFLPFETSMIK